MASQLAFVQVGVQQAAVVDVESEDRWVTPTAGTL